MDSLFRCEQMSLIQLYIPFEVAQATVYQLGELGNVEFRDLNPEVNAFQRAFVAEIRRLDEMERKIRFLQGQIEKAGIPLQPAPAELYNRTRSSQELDELEAAVQIHETRLLEMNSNYTRLLKQSLELTEKKHVLRETAVFFQEAEGREEEYRRHSMEAHGTNDDSPLLRGALNMEGGGDEGQTLGFVAGVITRERMATFEKILWRALRGNLYLKHVEIEELVTDPTTDAAVQKNVFVIFAHGREILSKIRKISESLGATLYPIDSSPELRRESALEVMSRLEDFQSVLSNTGQTRTHELTMVADSLMSWLTYVRKEKAVYYTLNLFNYDRGRSCLIAEGWCPTKTLPDIQNAIRNATEMANSNIFPIVTELKTKKEPPTFHRTNKFTVGFQNIVDAYGIAKYGEVNPGIFTIITFPFLFAMMFGDVGHGLMMALFAAYLCLRENSLAKENNEIFKMIFSGRYIMLLMGLFSIYTGMIYNDAFSQSLHIFKSGWQWTDIRRNQTAQALQVGVYPFGVDPNWHGCENALLFTNSYKMKMSIIVGVVHMSFGIVLTIFNYRHFKHSMAVWLEFLPQFLFMQSIFGYLCLMIIYKWSVDWFALDPITKAPIHGTPPGLLNTLIFMFLQPGKINPGEELYSGQGRVQYFLLVLAMICVPWMLLGKPLWEKYEHGKKNKAAYMPIGNHGEEVQSNGGENAEAEHEEFDFGDVMINQVIHTIEFCLGCISNTASYLRLWALSLAHAQLSTVLWDMTLSKAFYVSPSIMPIALVIAFYMWFTLTIGILLVMEGLSAFLHALRLHWVEFNNKFYQGSGKQFEPFLFRPVVIGEEDAAEE